jgi:hypothetical protein
LDFCHPVFSHFLLFGNKKILSVGFVGGRSGDAKGEFGVTKYRGPGFYGGDVFERNLFFEFEVFFIFLFFL